MNDKILTVKDAAELLQVSTKTMYDWANIPGFPALRIGNCIRIPYDLLMDWVNAQATRKEN